MITVLAIDENAEAKPYVKHIVDFEHTIESISIKPSLYNPVTVLLKAKSGEEFYVAKYINSVGKDVVFLQNNGIIKIFNENILELDEEDV